MTIENWDEIGWPAEGTRVYRSPGERIVIGSAAIERAERNAKWKAANRPDYLAGKRAWYHRWKAKWQASRTRSTRTASATTATRHGAKP